VRLLLVVLTLLLLPLVASAETLVGHADKVRDGDTVVVSGVPVRLQGVAAPELKEKWGRASRKAMQRLVAGKRLTCELTGKKTYDRKVGVCSLDDGTDIGAALVAEGLARDCPRYSGGRYAQFETQKSRTLPLPNYCR
jgi:endonuclease YncB( thermonuclease family)